MFNISSLNSLLTSTTSRYASLRRNILSSSSEDDSNITDPKDSHVSRVLQAYYTEKGRPIPAWLGVDPPEAAKAQQREQHPAAYVTSRPMGSLSAGRNPSDGRGTAGRGLSDLWGDDPRGGGGASPVEGRGSLRRDPLGGSRRPGQMQQPQQGSESVRPLPSQRVGSYQNPVPPGSSGSGGGSAQERLKARLGRGASSSGSVTPPQAERYEGKGGGGYEGGRDGQAERGGVGSYATQGLSGWQRTR